jgi:hypothetical protein
MAHLVEELRVEVESHVHVDSTKTFTTVVVTLTQGARFWTGIGTAKRARGDKFSEPIGTSLAMARALRDVAEDMEGEVAKAV